MKTRIEPGMLVLWTSKPDAPPMPATKFLGLVVEVIAETESKYLRRAARNFSVMATKTHGSEAGETKFFEISEVNLVPYSEENTELL